MFCIACLVLRFEIHEGAKDQRSSFREKTEVRKCTVKCCQSLGNLAASRLEGVWWSAPGPVPGLQVAMFPAPHGPSLTLIAPGTSRVLPHITLGFTAVLKSEKKVFY